MKHAGLWRAGWSALMLCGVATGCGAAAEEPRLIDCAPDSGCIGHLDPDASPTPGNSPDAGDAENDRTETGLACFDGQDNDGNSQRDCDDPACQVGNPICCVGRATASCCGAVETLASLSFGTCTGSLGSECSATGLTLFGSPLPYVVGGALFPGGDRSYDSGVVVGAPIAPGRAITLRATLALPAAACEDGCVEAAGVGLAPVATYGADSYVRALVGVVVSASRRSVELVLDGEGAGRAALPAGLSSLDLELVLGPDGSVQLSGVPSAPLTGHVTRAGALSLVAWGRNMNRIDAQGARIVALTASASTCDAPAVWTQRGALTLGAGGMSPPASLVGPSAADSATDSRLVFEADGRIVLARRSSAATPYAVVGGYENAALNDPSGGALHDPELIARDDGSWRVYVATDAGDIAYAEGAAGGDDFALRGVVAAPSALGAEIVRVDGPSVLAPSALDPLWHMVVRALDVDGASSLVHLVSSDGLTFTLPAGATLDDATLRVPQRIFGTFDRDEVASPELYRHAGTVGLAYSGRAGARWAIGLLVTDDFTHLRTLPAQSVDHDGAVLAATGGALDVDALSARDPDVIVRAGRVEMFYAGSDGVTSRLALAARPSIEGGI